MKMNLFQTMGFIKTKFSAINIYPVSLSGSDAASVQILCKIFADIFVTCLVEKIIIAATSFS